MKARDKNTLVTKDVLYERFVDSVNSQCGGHSSKLAIIIAWSEDEAATKLGEVQQQGAIQPELVYVLNLGGNKGGGPELLPC